MPLMKAWTTLFQARKGTWATLSLPALIVFIALLGAAHILVRTSNYGAALDNDSMNYISAAESLAAGEGLLDPGGSKFTMWPPFFPMAMAFLSLFGIEPVDGGRFLNIAAFGLTILALGLWLTRRLRTPAIALGVAVAVMAALPLTHAASTLLSDPLFILFTLLALMSLESFLNRRSGPRALALSAVFAALAALTRYIGVALIFYAVLMLLARRDTPVRRRLKHALAFGAGSSLPLACNQLLAGTLIGGRGALGSGQSLFDSLGQIVKVFHGWADPPLFPVHWQLPHSPWLIAGLLLLSAALLLIAPRPSRASSVFSVFTLTYLAILVAVTPFTVQEGGIGSRYLAPVYVPLLFVAAFRLDAFLSNKPSGRMSMVRWASAALALVGGSWHVGASVRQNLQFTAEALESGYIDKSFNTAYWEDSELLAYVRANPVSGRYYSNVPNALRWNAGVPGTLVTWVPVSRRGAHSIYDCQRWFEQVVLQSRLYEEPEKYAVWVGEGESIRINCTLSDMESPLPLEPVAELADGAIFKVNAAFDSADAYRSAYEARVSAYEALVSGEPAIRSDFDVYLHENTLTYVKEPCARADTEAKFFLHLYPVDANDLPIRRRQYGFDNLDFDFDGRGLIFDGRCMARIPLPEYAIARIETGRYVRVLGGSKRFWEAEISLEQ